MIAEKIARYFDLTVTVVLIAGGRPGVHLETYRVHCEACSAVVISLRKAWLLSAQERRRRVMVHDTKSIVFTSVAMA